MTVRSSSKRIQTLLGPFYAVLFAIIVFKKYRPHYLSSVSRGGQLKTGLNLIVLDLVVLNKRVEPDGSDRNNEFLQFYRHND